jgi:hypothetical protein
MKKDWLTGQFTTVGLEMLLEKIIMVYNMLQKLQKNNVLARTAVNLHLHGCKGFAFSKLLFLLLFQEK